MLRTFEAIKRSSFFNAIFSLRPISENASAEIRADAQQIAYYIPKRQTARQHKTPITGASAEIIAFALNLLYVKLNSTSSAVIRCMRGD